VYVADVERNTDAGGSYMTQRPHTVLSSLSDSLPVMSVSWLLLFFLAGFDRWELLAPFSGGKNATRRLCPSKGT
jgi:hypothetical protein